MGSTFSIRAGADYGDEPGAGDTQAVKRVLLAAQLVAQEFEGGVPALALALQVSPNTLQHKLNPNNVSHHLSLKEAVALQTVSGLPYVLYAMSAALDHVCLRSRPDVAEGDAWEAFRFLQQSMGELTAAAADALRGDGAVSANAHRRVEHQANELIAGVSALVNAVAARSPKREA